MEPEITLSNGRKIGPRHPVFIIAEIGQNHQGDIGIAKELIKLAKEIKVDCVKFQKTSLNDKFTQKKLNEGYTSIHSFGSTYGEHKSRLELSDDDFLQLQSFANELDILFTASAMDEPSLDFLIQLNVPFIKIGSGDTNNFPLLEQANKCIIPIILSTGMSHLDTVIKAYDILRHGHPVNLCQEFFRSSIPDGCHSDECIKNRRSQIALLHCVSSYPTPICEINLNVIQKYQQLFPDSVIGYSGHEEGIDVTLTAVTEFASCIIERHLTLDKTMKGTDHSCSLNGDEFKLLVDRIRSSELNHKVDQEIIRKSAGLDEKKRQSSEISCWTKLGKSVVASRLLDPGDIIKRPDLLVKVSTVPKGFPGEKFYDLIGKTVIERIESDSPIQEHQVSK